LSSLDPEVPPDIVAGIAGNASGCFNGHPMAQADAQHEPPFRGRATIRDIADLAGVSIATVSRVINDRPDVAPETRENVLQVVRAHGFSTNRGARGLSSGRTGMIGLTLPLVADAYFGPMLGGAAEALYERDMRIVLAPTLHEHDREVSLLERLMRGTTDGAILMLPEESADELQMLQRQGFPFVVVDPREAPPEGIACVAAMHAAGAKQATEHLLELGHRRIGAIAGAPGWYATEERLLGFRAALAGAGILLDRELVVYSDWRIPRGTEAAEQLLALPDPPTAIFGFNDNVAIGALHAARNRGLSVPDDLSIVGFDDTEQAMIVTPQLTSVRQPLAEMGRMGVSLLIRIIEGQRVDAMRLELSTKLVVRGSTGPPPGS
jgi:LacI family transcriptional regulator